MISPAWCISSVGAAVVCSGERSIICASGKKCESHSQSYLTEKSCILECSQYGNVEDESDGERGFAPCTLTFVDESAYEVVYDDTSYHQEHIYWFAPRIEYQREYYQNYVFGYIAVVACPSVYARSQEVAQDECGQECEDKE